MFAFDLLAARAIGIGPIRLQCVCVGVETRGCSWVFRTMPTDMLITRAGVCSVQAAAHTQGSHSRYIRHFIDFCFLLFSRLTVRAETRDTFAHFKSSTYNYNKDPGWRDREARCDEDEVEDAA